MINGVLTGGDSFKDIFRAVDENEGPDGEENDHDCPKERHENDSTSLFEDSGENYIAVEGNARFLNLGLSCEQSCYVGKRNTYKPCYVCNCRCNHGTSLRVVCVEGILERLSKMFLWMKRSQLRSSACNTLPKMEQESKFFT